MGITTRSFVAAILCCTLLSGCSLVQGRRELKQTAAASPVAGYGYYYDYGGVEACYSALDVIAALNGTTGNLTLFVDALEATGLIDFLADPLQAVTVFAPTDAAIMAVANQMNMSPDQLLESPQLLIILLYHLIQEPILTGELSSGDVLPSALGQLLNVTVENMPDTDGDNYTIALAATDSNATLIDTDYCNCESCTAVVNVIDTVLLPNITNVTTQGGETTITVSNSSGAKEYILVYTANTPASAPAATGTTPTAMQAAGPTPSSMAPSAYRAGSSLSSTLTYVASNQGNL